MLFTIMCSLKPRLRAAHLPGSSRGSVAELGSEPRTNGPQALTHLTLSFHRAVQDVSFLIQNLGERGYYEAKNVTLQRWRMPMELRNPASPEALPPPTEDHLDLSTGSARAPAKPPTSLLLNSGSQHQGKTSVGKSPMLAMPASPPRAPVAISTEEHQVGAPSDSQS